MKNLTLLTLFTATFAAPMPSSWAAEKPAEFTISEYACSKRESWKFSSDVPKDWADEFNEFLKGNLSHSISFSEALGMQKNPSSKASDYFSVYWKNRALFEADLVHTASSGFFWLASREIKRETLGIQLAALECLNQIHYKYTRIVIPDQVAERFSDYAILVNGSRSEDIRGRESFWQAAAIYVRTLISEGGSEEKILAALSNLRESGAYLELSKGLAYAHLEKFDQAAAELKKFVNRSSPPDPLKKYLDSARLTLARSLYKSENYKEAELELKKVSKDSNELVRVLAELSWVYYIQNRYGDSVGTVMNLQSGGLRRTFAPEALMVMSMALNELCQYPSSLRTIRFIKSHYRTAYDWLRQWYLNSKEGTAGERDYYATIVKHLSGKKVPIPERILLEWLKSPVFISHQDEMNLFADERDAEKKFKKDQMQMLSKKVKEVKELAKDVKERTVSEKAKDKKDAKLANDGVRKLKFERERLERLKESVSSFAKIVAVAKRQAEQIKPVLIGRINDDLNSMNVRMFKRLKETAENTYLVEVEIYNGASEDIVWQNAHPDYKKFVEKLQQEAKLANEEKVWNWGKSQKAEDGQQEIWADELGTLRVDLDDNCGNKDRFLEVKYEDMLATRKGDKE